LGEKIFLRLIKMMTKTSTKIFLKRNRFLSNVADHLPKSKINFNLSINFITLNNLEDIE